MNIEQEGMQSLGPIGILKTAYRIVLSCKLIFTQIALAFILPLSIILLVDSRLSRFLAVDIARDEFVLDETSAASPVHQKFSTLLSSDLTALFLVKATTFTLLLLFSLLSTSAVAYAVACIYSSQVLTLKNILAVVPKVWVRFTATYLCVLAAAFMYISAAIALVLLWVFLIGPTKLGIAILLAASAVYVVGFVYSAMVWQLASVVSVLEDVGGFAAIMKSLALLRGKARTAAVVYLALNVCSAVVHVAYRRVRLPAWLAAGSLVVYLSLMSLMTLYGLVTQAVIYLACKSYHHESVDKAALSEHLEVYRGMYEPLKDQDVQLHQFQV